MTAPSPLVYVGPSLPSREVQEILPGCRIRGPVRRGDLYRDRQDGGTIFLILDGVFHQQEAISPREVLDVLADGALVAGAASMGALRAAECWPAGMLGVGTIYRLFRRGSLTSDDEVALVFEPESWRPLSVPLVNARHALARAARCRRLDRALAERIARAAEETFYSERTWRAILSRAGVGPEAGDLEGFLSGFDLKAEDARRAVHRLARWLAADPGLGHRPRRSPEPFRPTGEVRERGTDALAGADPAEVRRRLGRWQLASGRYARHLAGLVAAEDGPGLAARLEGMGLQTSLLAERLLHDEAASGHRKSARPPAVPREAFHGPLAFRLVSLELWKAWLADEQAFSEKLWAELTVSGELEAEIFRWRALREAVATATRLGLRPRVQDRYGAAAEIAYAHGYPSWPALRQAAGPIGSSWSCFTEHRDEMALVRRLREDLFRPGAEPLPVRRRFPI